MANRYLKTAGGNWSAAATWSATGAGGIDSVGPPTAADNVIMELASGNVTIDAGAVCRSLDTTSGTGSYAGTITHTAAVTLTIGDATAGASNVAFKLNSGMTYTLGNATTSAITFASTSSTQQTITTGGKTLGSLTWQTAGNWILSDNLTATGGGGIHNAGTLDFSGRTISWQSFTISTSTTKSLTLGAASITCLGSGGWNISNATGLTFSGASATITCTNNGTLNFGGGGQTYGTVNINPSAAGTPAITGANSYTNLSLTSSTNKTTIVTLAANQTVTGTFAVTGNSAVNRLLVQSTIFAATRTITAAAVSLTNVDFNDIAGAGAAAPFTGTSLGDAVGNSGITFDAPTTQTHDGTTSSWSTAARWTSRVPLPQDTALIPSGSGTITGDMPRLGADINFTGFVGTFAPSLAWSFQGSITFASGMTFTQGTFTTTANGRTTHTITSAGKSFYTLIVNSAITSVYTFADAITCTDTGLTTGLTVQRGTVTWQGNVTASVFLSSSSNSKTFNMGSGTWSLTGTSGTLWSVAGTPVVINADISTIVIASASASTRTFAGGGQTFNTLTYTVDNSPGSLTITGANTFANLNVDSGKIVTMPSATTTAITNTFNVNGAVNGYIYLPGVAANYASAPDSAALSITGDITIDAKVALDDWTPAATNALVGKTGSTTTRSYTLFVNITTGALNLQTSPDGSTAQSTASTAAPVVADGQPLWVRVSFDVDDGAGNRVHRFYTSSDGIAWSQLGTTVTTAGATSIFNSTSVLELGSNFIGLNNMTGKIYNARIYAADLGSGSGTPVFDADFTTKPFGANTFTESSANAATVTINGTLAQAGDGRVSLISSTPGSRSTLSKSSGVVSSDYLTIQDSAATGGAKWYAGANSVDVSNNTGWIFSGTAASSQFFGMFE